jgi:hypothetical protein
MNWDRHWDVFDAAYRWGLETLDQLKSSNNPAIAAIEHAVTERSFDYQRESSVE